MRPVLLISVLLLLLPVYGQVRVSAGARAGFNIAHIRHTPVPDGYDKKIMLGSNFGALLRVSFGEHFGVQTEVLFSQKGQRWTQQIDNFDTYQKLVSNYIEFPVLGVARVGGEKVKAVFCLGAYFAYWSGGYLETAVRQDKQTVNSDHTDQVFTSDERRFDAGLASGIGMEIKAGPGAVELAVRHDLGLADRSRSDEPHTATYNCNMFFSAAYLVPLGK